MVALGLLAERLVRGFEAVEVVLYLDVFAFLSRDVDQYLIPSSQY